MRVVDREGNELLPETRVRPADHHQRPGEHRRQGRGGTPVAGEMRQILVQQLLRKLRFLAENSTGVTPPGARP